MKQDLLLKIQIRKISDKRAPQLREMKTILTDDENVVGEIEEYYKNNLPEYYSYKDHDIVFTIEDRAFNNWEI